MTIRSEKTIERYVGLYIRFQSTDNELSEVSTWNLDTFTEQTGLKTESQFKLLKALARNVEIQQDINNYLSNKGISSRVIKPIVEQQYLEKNVRISKGVPFKDFTKKSRYFESIKGKRVEIITNPQNFKNDAKLLVKIAYDKALHQTQKYDGKQIKINIEADIVPDSKSKDRVITNKSWQTMARRNKADLEYDMDELVNGIDAYITKYKPKGSITITISIVNYYE